MDAEKKKIFIQSCEAALLDFLENAIVKQGLVQILGSTAVAAGGLKVWLVKFALEEGYEEIAKPIANAAMVEVGYKIDVIDGKKALVKLHAAQEAGDATAYDHAADVILS